jgi:calcium-dependent protein kinase
MAEDISEPILAAPKNREYAFEPNPYLGKGGFGRVFKVRSTRSDTLHALKEVTLEGNAASRQGPQGSGVVHTSEMELQLMDCLQKTSSGSKFVHPNIIQLIDHWKDHEKNKLFIVVEYCADGDLSVGISEGKYKEHIAIITEQLVSALAFCESKRVLHLDIKPENVLLRSTPDGLIVKLADFGLSHYQGRRSQISSIVGGTQMFTAPEVISWGQKLISSKVDVWATGVSLNWVVYQRSPFTQNGEDMNLYQIMTSLKEDPDFLTIGAELLRDGRTRDAINRMVVVDVKNRLSPDELARTLGINQDTPYAQVSRERRESAW